AIEPSARYLELTGQSRDGWPPSPSRYLRARGSAARACGTPFVAIPASTNRRYPRLRLGQRSAVNRVITQASAAVPPVTAALKPVRPVSVGRNAGAARRARELPRTRRPGF